MSLLEAPAPTRTFFWGDANVTAPGLGGPPRDTLTLALDADDQLRYLSWKTLAAFPKTFGDGPSDFPLTGTKHVEPPNSTAIFDATVEDAPDPTPSHFLLRMRIVSTDKLSDYVESTAGTRAGDGWAIIYSEQGDLFGAAIDAQGDGTLYAGDPNARAARAGQASVWSAPVELSAPGFFGPPVDHLTVALSASGQLRSFSFERFVRGRQSFGTGPDDLPLSGMGTHGDLTITVDETVAPTSSHFVLRYHAQGPPGLTDFVEGLEGTRSGATLVVRYFIKGTLMGPAIDAHAAGTLVPNVPGDGGASH